MASSSTSLANGSKLTLQSTAHSVDSSISLLLHNSIQNSWSGRVLLVALEFSGDGRFSIPLVIALWLSSLISSPDHRAAFLGCFIALLLDLAVVGSIKGIVRRPRPSYNRGMHLVVSVDKWSFPSGHASRAFLIAALAPSLLNLPPSLDPFALPPISDPMRATVYALWAVWMWSAMTALSRVFLGRHYLADIIVGSCLGVLEAHVARRFLSPPVATSEAIRGLALSCLSLQWQHCSVPRWQAVAQQAFS